MLEYQRMIRPAVEARSTVIPITFGCSWANCQFCTINRDNPFRIRSLEEVRADIDGVAQRGPVSDRVFLADGDALVVRHERLVAVLEYIRAKLPWVQRVGIYGNTWDILRRTPQQLRELKALGLGLIYQGFESGDDQVLEAMQKGCTAAQQVEAGRRVLEAGLLLSCTVVLGLGGKARSKEHAWHTAHRLTEMTPSSIRVHTIVVSPLAPLYRTWQEGGFEPPDAMEILEEERIIVEQTELWDTPFIANMKSNYLPLVGLLANERSALLAQIEEVLAHRDYAKLRPEAVRLTQF